MTPYRRLTVTVPATVTALTTLDRVKSEINKTTTDDDDWLTTTIQEESDLISGICNRVFARETVTETLKLRNDWRGQPESEGPEELVLSRFPLISITSLAESFPSAALTLVEDTDFEADYASGRIFRLSALGSPRRWPLAVETIVYQAGYVLPGDTGAPNGSIALPSDLEKACVRLVKLRWHGRTRDPLLRSEEQPGLGRQEYWTGGQGGDFGLPSDIASVLARYRSTITG